MKINEILNEGLTGVVYHITTLYALSEMLRTGEIKLSPALPDEHPGKEYILGKGKLFYLSLSRTRTSRYLLKFRRGTADNPPVLLTLDGNALSNKYRSVPVDFYSNSADKRGSETEDRIITDHPVIMGSLKYITGIEVVYDGKSNEAEQFLSALQVNAGKRYDITVYPTTRDMLIRNRKVARPLSEVVSNMDPANYIPRKPAIAYPVIDVLYYAMGDIEPTEWPNEVQTAFLSTMQNFRNRPTSAVAEITDAVVSAVYQRRYSDTITKLYQEARKRGYSSVSPLIQDILEKWRKEFREVKRNRK